jgi:acetoin utilization protein AcuB
MRVHEVMSASVVTVPISATCQEAVGRMHRARIRHLPVVDDAGRLVGIVTDRDLRHRLFTPDVFRAIGTVPVEDLLRQVRVLEIMSTPVVTVRPDDDLEEAARLMLEDKVGSLPVVEGGRVTGIVTETDLLRRIVQADSCSTAVENIIVSFP